MTARFEIEVGGRLPRSLPALISARFGPVEVVEHRGSTAIHGSVADQAALRALLSLIWDVGGSVVCFVLTPVTGPARSPGTEVVRPLPVGGGTSP